MAIRRVESARKLPADSFEGQAKEYIHVKREVDQRSKRLAELRDSLLAVLVERGEEDSEGHLVVPLADEFEGYVGLARQRRVATPKVDTEVAERILTEAGLWDRCAPPTPVINTDEIYACLYEGLLTEEQVFEMFPEKITYALVMKRG